MPGMTVRDRVMATPRRNPWRGLMRRRCIEHAVDGLVATQNGKPSRPAQVMRRPSGGNRQRVPLLLAHAAPCPVVQDRTPFGTQVAAVGDNVRAARLSGLSVSAIRAATHGAVRVACRRWRDDPVVPDSRRLCDLRQVRDRTGCNRRRCVGWHPGLGRRRVGGGASCGMTVQRQGPERSSPCGHC